MNTPRPSTLRPRFAPLTFVALALALQAASPADAGGPPTACSDSRAAALEACRSDIDAEYWTAIGICDNDSNPADELTCKAEAESTRLDELEHCDDQDDARADVCATLGEAPYDPAINPANFVDPAQIGHGIAPNRYLPITRGLKWTYKGEDEAIVVTVTSKIKKILGVRCAVVRDVVKEDGVVVEDTEDWFAQDVLGNIWYMGEISREYENGELVSLDGSWKAGRDGARPGILMHAAPQVGTTYRQEFLLGEAEDLATVLSTTGSANTPAGSCSGTCVVTLDFTTIEPGHLEHKYYKRGVGMIQEIDPDTGLAKVKLVSFQQP